MNIKKFTDFSLTENIDTEEIEKELDEEQLENEEDKADVETPSEEGLPFDSDLDEIGDDASEEDDANDSNLSDYTDYTKFSNKENTPIKNEAIETIASGSKIVIINGCEPDSDINKKTEEFKSKFDGETKEIYLYQLNIQSAKKQEPKDGMMQVYEAIENADAIILACQINKGKLSESLEIAISRIKNFYKKEELKNKIFGAIIIGSDDKVKNDLILTALNDFHMVICGDCLFFSNDKSSSNMTKMIDSITSLSKATALINKGDDIEDVIVDDIKPYDEFSDLDTEKEEDTEEDNYVDSLKDDLSIDDDNEPEEEKEEDLEDSEEEEERLIDNENGTITQIHKGEKVTENKEVEEEIEILTFDKFFDK